MTLRCARGWTQGFPKKMGSIFFRPFLLGQRRGARRVSSRFGASLSAHWQRLAEACVTLHKPVENGMSSSVGPTVLLDTSRDWRPATRTSLRSTSWRCRSPTISPWSAHGSGRASQFSGSEWRRTPSTRAKQDRVRVSLLISYSLAI